MNFSNSPSFGTEFEDYSKRFIGLILNNSAKKIGKIFSFFLSFRAILVRWNDSFEYIEANISDRCEQNRRNNL